MRDEIKFFNEIQKQKMKELWDNKDDEELEEIYSKK